MRSVDVNNVGEWFCPAEGRIDPEPVRPPDDFANVAMNGARNGIVSNADDELWRSKKPTMDGVGSANEPDCDWTGLKPTGLT